MIAELANGKKSMKHLNLTSYSLFKRRIGFVLALGTCFTLGPSTLVLHAQSDHGVPWNSKTAAAYLDQRTTGWMRGGAMDHGTFCISCHTALPYALARPALRTNLGERGPSPVERQLLASVTKRVRLWTEVQPYLNDKSGGPGTEAVLNALVLVTCDAPRRTLSDDTRHALDTMWALQLKSGASAGAWPWVNAHNEPWEAFDSQYWGATLAAVAVGTLPREYRSAAEHQDNLTLLKAYLQRGQHEQSLLNRLSLLWAATKLPGLLSADQKASLVHAVLARQQPDGGWSASDLVVSTWRRHDGTLLETKSDGYGTGLAAFVIQHAGIPHTRSAMNAARRWLIRNQDQTTGLWPAYSLNKQRDPASDVGRFMSDAATAYSVLALTDEKPPG
jgi:squalene-hopene/tetraprenyl-beta-curcumene cyclase